MDVAILKSFKKQYFFAPIIFFYMRHCNYEKLKLVLCQDLAQNEMRSSVS